MASPARKPQPFHDGTISQEPADLRGTLLLITKINTPCRRHPPIVEVIVGKHRITSTQRLHQRRIRAADPVAMDVEPAEKP